MSPVIVALDFADADTALQFVSRIDPTLCRVKVGKELFTRAGPDLVKTLVKRGFDVFLDLKFHDIPNTVAAACRAAADLGVWMLNVHAQGGKPMLEAARAALPETRQPNPLLIAVSVLTSFDQQNLQETGVVDSLSQQVQRLARLSYQAGLDGVVCSAQEAELLRADFADDFCLVTPGIRPAFAQSSDDQRRIMTPQAAVAAGASYLVMGRPITLADDPIKALQIVNEGINNVKIHSAHCQ